MDQQNKVFYLEIEKNISPSLQLQAQLTIPLCPSSLTAFYGPSGSGKTTLLRCISGLDFPDQGIISMGEEIWVDTKKKLNLPPYRRNIGYVVQEDALFPHLRVEKNVGYGLKKKEGLSRADIKLKISQALKKTGIEQLASRWPSSLSGGEKRRVALARAIARQPSLLLLDEPLNGLDFKAKEQIRGLIEEIAYQSGCLTIMISHDKAEIIQMARYVGIISSGKLLQFGETRQVFSEPATIEVASIIGIENIIPGEIVYLEQGKVVVETPIGQLEAVLKERKDVFFRGRKIFCLFRAEDVSILKNDGLADRDIPKGSFSVRNRYTGRVKKIKMTEGLAHLSIDCGIMLNALISQSSLIEMKIRDGDSVSALVKTGAIHLIERDF
ncbi:ABC transporter ATP-binding protein [Methylacidiphilum caldifontis]|uniref:Fe3+/spermidine/putrescine ABC transporter ATP-binding protein n=1 Tax=Methylacidiphilum caldifontis TaxID=2795386 RepID=A0A4Y8PC99_9BACT|nr:ATP-binding cassette domain-containing protein [Methylacidiphilum caldifontis]QSR89037.1 ATP-binding cassette domain-containing protein [Methylacidiphilum caldifontis]TFE68632.1 Fe3+/spermidine/putrescine ABC transporter ATP-binding protein [Methylacidiphilum caldifontis]